MNESKHTPGPWRIAKPKNPDLRQIEDRLIYTIVDNEKFHIAEVYQYHNDKYRNADGSSLSNAHLISRAPELLEENKKVISQRNQLLKTSSALAGWLDRKTVPGDLYDAWKSAIDDCIPKKGKS